MDKAIRQLEQLLRQELERHEQLHGLLQKKMQAFRASEHDQLQQISKHENEQVQAIGELAKERMMLIGEMTQQIDPDATQPLRLIELAERLDEPARGRLLVLRQQLKERMEAIRQETSMLKRVTQSVVNHMQGIVQSIGAKLSGVATYGSKGARPMQATAVSTFSMTA